MQIIVKIQKPLMSNVEGTPPYLIYNKDRTVQLQIEADKTLRQLMKKYDKRYFHAELITNGKAYDLKIGKPTTTQDW